MSTPVQHPLGEHLPTCSGPENCAEYSAILNMTPTQYVDYINDSTARFAAIRNARRAGTDTARTFRVSKPTTPESFEPPDSYEPALAKLRAARATPQSTFAQRYAEERRAELQAEYRAAERSTPRPAPRRLTAAESAAYAPPDAYKKGLEALRQENTR